MSVEIDRIKSISIFSKLTTHQLSSCELLLEHRRLKAGKGLWWQGEPSDELAFVSSGDLDIKIANHHIATIAQGELVGELAVFTRDQRTASVLAGANGAEVLCLSRQNLETIQQILPELYDNLLEVALDKSARRVHEMGKSIAKLAQGGRASPKRKEENAFGKLWQRLTSGGNQNPPSALSAIRKLPRLKNAPMQHLQAIISVMTPRQVNKGHALFLEGDVGYSVYLLVEGCIDVMRNVGGGRAERLATLFPGALFGTGALLLRERRNAACVASDNTSCWVYELHVDAYRKLKGPPGHLLRESLLASLAFQLRNADDKLILLKTGSRPKQSDYDSIRGGLTGFQGGER